VFLQQFLSLLKEGKVSFAPRSNKNSEFLLEYDLTADDVLEFCTRLKPEHYQWGPRDDHNKTEGDIWVFYLPCNEFGITLYIKIKLWMKPESGGAIISFHEEGKHND